MSRRRQAESAMMTAGLGLDLVVGLAAVFVVHFDWHVEEMHSR
jgi:hypothetical protein